jgi:zinc-finger-containing domain
MRVGRPVQLSPQPICEYCGANAKLTRFGDEPYPYRDDHGPVWVCTPCQAWIGIFTRSARNVPLGRLANAQLREWKAKLHSALEPMAEAKVRRDGGKIFAARAKGYKWLAGHLSIEEQKCSIHLLDIDQCKAAVAIIARFELERRPGHTSESAPPNR